MILWLSSVRRGLVVQRLIALFDSSWAWEPWVRVRPLPFECPKHGASWLAMKSAAVKDNLQLEKERFERLKQALQLSIAEYLFSRFELDSCGLPATTVKFSSIENQGQRVRQFDAVGLSVPAL